MLEFAGVDRPPLLGCERDEVRVDGRSTGFERVMTLYGFFRSVGWNVLLQFSQTSPYWSAAPHFGHSPFT